MAIYNAVEGLQTNETTAEPFDLEALLEDHADERFSLYSEHINPSLRQVLKILGMDVHFERGEGPYLFDREGRRYVDCLAGYGTFACGRNHPVIKSALQQALDLDLPNLIKMGIGKLSGLLARELAQIAPGDLPMVFFTNSGSESVETALKYARAATGRPRFVHCTKSFHGLTYGALSVNGNKEFQAGFSPLLEQTASVPFNNLAALEQELSKKDVAGFIVEPIQGKGVAIPDDDYLPGVAALCRKYGTLLIADEVQTGFGRTGKMFACEHWGLEPDIVTTAKALSGGYVPVGAVLTRRWIHDKVFSCLDRCVVHSTTYGQNDLAMAAGLATLHVLRTEKIVENAARQGERLMTGLSELGEKYEMFAGVRGRGLMIGIEFQAPRSMTLKMGWDLLHKLDPSLFCQAMLIPLFTDHRVLAQVAGHHLDVIKLLPALTLSDADVSDLLNAFDQVIAACHRFPGPVWEVGKRMSMHALRR